jgi:hypothetical protein
MENADTQVPLAALKTQLAAGDEVSDRKTQSWSKPGEPESVGTFCMPSAMEAVVAVATMAALAAVPMPGCENLVWTTVIGWMARLGGLTFFEVHEALTVRVVEYLPTGIMQFRTLFCCWVAFSLLRFHPAQARFYRWFTKSGVPPSKKRGFGYFGCRAFGIFQAPVLTQFQFHLSCVLMALCLVLAACPLNNIHVTRTCLIGALILYVLYFSQLFCESRAAGHGTIIIPLVLVHLICGGDAGSWTIFLLKMHIAACYFSAGYGKLIVGLWFGKFWGDGTSQQYLFFESMWSRPGGFLSQTLQRFAFRRLWVCSFLSTFTLLFQVSVPLSLLDLRVSWLFFILSFSFHAGILVTTNISFMPYWVPALLIFLFPHGNAPYDGAWESASYAMSGAWEMSPIGITCILAFMMVQAVVTLGLVDLTYGDILPFSCEPMFVLPRSLHDRWPKLLVMTTADCRQAGHVEPYLFTTFNPLSSHFPLDEESMWKLPAKTLIFSTLKTIPTEVNNIVNDNVKPAPFYVWSNVPIHGHFMKTLGEVAEILNDSEHPAFSDDAKLERLIALQHQCAEAFQSACFQEPEVCGFKGGTESGPIWPSKSR